MLDDKDLEAIGQLMAQREERILEESTRRMKLLLKNLVDPKFNLLAENQQMFLDRMGAQEDSEVLESRIDALEMVVRKHSWEITNLRKAN